MYDEVYLSGGMSKYGKDNFDTANGWRTKATDFLGIHDVVTFNPNDYYSFGDDVPRYQTQKEVMNYDLYRLKGSKIVLVNFNDPQSIGTACECTVAHELGIPIIGVNEAGEPLHPWLTEMCEKIYHNLEDALEYIIEYYYVSQVKQIVFKPNTTPKEDFAFSVEEVLQMDDCK